MNTVSSNHIPACLPRPRRPGEFWWTCDLRDGERYTPLLDARERQLRITGLSAACPCGCGGELNVRFAIADAEGRGAQFARWDHRKDSPTLSAALQCPKGTWWRLVAGAWLDITRKAQPQPDFDA